MEDYIEEDFREEGKVIDGFPGYRISNKGRVLSNRCRKPRFLKPQMNPNGYYKYTLVKGADVYQFYVHQLVAKMFIDNPNNYTEVNHIDEDKSNNVVTNLEGCNHSYNCTHGERNERIRLAHCKPVMCIETGEVFESIEKACEAYDIKSPTNITSVCKGRTKTANKMHGKYI